MSAGSRFYDVGATIGGRFGSIVTATAGGAGDNTEAAGQTIDRDGFNSAAVLVAYQAALGASASLSLRVEREESDDATTWTGAKDVRANAVVVTASGAGTYRGVVKIRDEYEVCARHVRYNVHPDLSAANTDTVTLATVVAVGGANTLPVA